MITTGSSLDRYVDRVWISFMQTANHHLLTPLLSKSVVCLGPQLGHNLGLTHTGSMVCRIDSSGAIDRHPSACRPDW